jgi:hypothetical protein
MKYRKLHEMIDACRPGSEDIRLPEMSPLADRIAGDPELRHRYQQTQRLDARLGQAVGEIEIPIGLRERILARLEGAGNGGQGPGARGQGPGEAAQGAGAMGDGGVALAPVRRWWVFTLAAIAAGLLLLVAGYSVWPRRPAFTYDKLLNSSSQWFEQLRANSAWQPLAARQVIRDFPVAEAIRPRPRFWADVSSLVGQSACAYDLSTADGRRATLFVIPDDSQVADSSPPLKPGSSTGGLMIGCWQSGDFVYVLVVEGNERTYRSLLDDAGPPLACWLVQRCRRTG